MRWSLLVLLALAGPARADEIADQLHDCQKRETALRDVVNAIDEAGVASAEVAVEAQLIRVHLAPIEQHCTLMKLAAKRISTLSIELSAARGDDRAPLEHRLAKLTDAVAISHDGYEADVAVAIDAAARIKTLLSRARLALADEDLEARCRHDADACIDLGDQHDGKKARRYYAAAVKLLDRDCKRGDADACDALAEAYELGDLGVAASDRKGEKLRARAFALRQATSSK